MVYTLKKTASGKLRMNNDNRVLTRGCCCKCRPRLDLEAISSTCIPQPNSGCCYKRGDTVTVTFGAITSSGTGSYAVSANQLAQDLGGASLTLTFSSSSIASTGDFGFEFFSIPVPPDVPDGWVYGYYVYIRMVSTTGTTSGMSWPVYAQAFKVLETAYYAGGNCFPDEENRLDILQPGSVPLGSCCGSPTAMPMNPLVVGMFTEFEDITGIVASTDCGNPCDCPGAADSLLVETGDFSLTVTRPEEAPDCDWTGSGTTGGDCPASDYQVRLHRDGCVWIALLEVQHYALVSGECVLTGVEEATYIRHGGDHLGAYARSEGTAGGPTLEVS